MALVLGFIAVALLLVVLGGADLLLALLVAAPVLSLFLLNAWLMAANPAKWLRSSDWWVLRGGISQTRYATKWGLLEIRLCGAVLFSGAVWMIIELLRR